MAWQEAKEEMGKMVRWNEVATSKQENTVYIGPVLQGIYERRKDDVGPNDSKVYEIRMADGSLNSMWGSDLLDGKFEKVPLGSEVRITFLGVAQPKTPKGRAYNNFKVEFAPPAPQTMREATSEPSNVAGPAPTVPASNNASQAVDEGY